MYKKALCLVLILLLLPLGVFAGEQEVKPFTVKAELFQGEEKVKSLKEKEEADLVLTFESTQYKHEDLKKLEDLVIQHDEKTFVGEKKAQLKLLSKEQEKLKVEARFPKLIYSGKGSSFRYSLEAKLGKNLKLEDQIQIKELVPSSPGGSNPGEVHEIPEPQVLVSRKELTESLKPGEEVDLVLQLKNTGSTTMKSPVLRFGASSGLLFPSGNTSRMVGDLEAGKTAELNVRLKASEQLNSDKQQLEVKLSFTYDSGKGMRQAEQKDVVEIPVSLLKEKEGEARLSLTHTPLEKPLSPSESFPLEVKVTNTGKATLKTLSLRPELGQGLSLINQDPLVIDELKAGEERKIQVELKTWDELGEQPLSLTLRMDYSYEKEGKTEKEQLEEKVLLPLAAKEPKEPKGEEETPSTDSGGGDYSSGITTPKLDSAVPNLIVQKFSYGEKPIAAGQSFDLSMEYGNTSKSIGIENIVMMIEPGENFSIDGASNTYYMESMGASATKKQNLKLRALPSAKTGASGIEVTFKYEYVDNDKRSQASITQKLSVPIFQPDRFQISAPEIPTDARVGEELTLSLAYVNKGKSEVSNVEAHVEGDVESVSKVQNLGNFEPGKSGNVSFILTPKKEGELKLKLKVSYEDANQEIKTKEFPVTLTVQAAIEEMPTEESPPEEEPKKSFVLPLLLGGGGLLLVAGVYLYLKRRKKADDSWDDLDEEF